MPEIIILAGPNGAGKSTFAEQFQRDQEDIAYVNADQKAVELQRLYGIDAQYGRCRCAVDAA